MEAGHAAEIHLPHQIANYFSMIIFKSRCSKRHLESLIRLYTQRHKFNLHFPALYHPLSISITFSFMCFSHCLPLSLSAPSLCLTIFFSSHSLSIFQESASQMSPPVTTSLIDLRTATGIDLKQPCSQAQKKSFLLARLLMTWWNAPCCLCTYRDSLHESPVLGLCRWCIDDRREDRKTFFPMSILRHWKMSEIRCCGRDCRICALLGIYRRFWWSGMSAGWAQLIIHRWQVQQMSHEMNNGELLSILPAPRALHSFAFHQTV